MIRSVRRWLVRMCYPGRHRRGRTGDSRIAVLASVLVLGVLATLSSPAPTPRPFPQTNKLEAEAGIQDRQDEAVRSARDADRKARRPKAPWAPPWGVLVPRTPQGRQASFWPKPSQMNNARTIVQVAREMKLPHRAMTIAIATALQESHLNNYGHLGARNDHDSLGLFQQRPSAGWGAPAQVTNPRYAATVFYKSLLKVRGWQNLPLTVAAQRVQRSAFPFAYAKWESMAGNIVRGTYGVGPYAEIK